MSDHTRSNTIIRCVITICLENSSVARPSFLRAATGCQTDHRTSPPCYKPPQPALEFCPIHCPNGRLGQDLGFGGIAFALKLPELLNTNLAAVRAKLGQTSCFHNGPQIWCPIRQ